MTKKRRDDVEYGPNYFDLMQIPILVILAKI